jgi:hypothetical protein
MSIKIAETSSIEKSLKVPQRGTFKLFSGFQILVVK